MGAQQDVDESVVNEVHLVGTVSGEPQVRTMPSGDELVQLRVVVRRPPTASPRGDGGAPARRPQVDTIDIACWSSPSRRSAARLSPGDPVEVHGALRRRFFATGGGRQSRYEVEASALRRPRPVARQP